MIGTYIRIAWRHMVKTRLHSSINVIGLALGMAVTMLIGLWIWDECSFDYYHANHRRLAQVYDSQTWNGKTSTDKEISIPLAEELRRSFGNYFKRVALLSPAESAHQLRAGDQKISTTILFAGAELPDMLSLVMLYGRREGLQDPGAVLLTASLARSLFGNIDPVGRVIRMDNEMSLQVAGVYEDLPSNSSFEFIKCLLSWDRFVGTHSWVKEEGGLWQNHFGRLIVELNEGVDVDRATAVVRGIPAKHTLEGKEEIFLLPMDKWHLYNEFRDGKVAGGRIRFVWLFGIIGVFVLLLACINFMNLSTARSGQRAKEVGIRKTIGSMRGQLIAQFLTESMLLAILSMLLALSLVLLSLPGFNALLANKQLRLPWGSWPFWLLVTGFSLITGLIAGSYPAFYLSAFNPVKVLKGPFRAGRYAAWPRRVLVTVQFTVSIVLIIGTIIVFNQVEYAKSRPVGYRREGLIQVNTRYQGGQLSDHFDALRSELVSTGVIDAVGSSNGSPTGIWISESGYSWTGKDPNLNPMFRTVGVTTDFGKTLGWQIMEGRDFSSELDRDTLTVPVILNQAAVKMMGVKDPVGLLITWHRYRNRVVGVIKDMVMESPYKPAEPTIFWPMRDWSDYVVLRARAGVPMQKVLAAIAPVFKRFNPDRPFDYRWVDESYEAKFAAEERIGRLAAVFTVLAIVICCLGLFGLASFIAAQRTKEIGIRKVLGATVLQLWGLLSKEFVLLVLLSFVLAAPVAWSYLRQWLQGYEYRVDITWWVFAAAGLGSLGIALLTVSVQAIRAAIVNPVKSLKTE